MPTRFLLLAPTGRVTTEATPETRVIPARLLNLGDEEGLKRANELDRQARGDFDPSLRADLSQA